MTNITSCRHSAKNALIANAADYAWEDRGVIDLLTNLQHFCDEEDISFNQILEIARDRHRIDITHTT